MYRNFATLIAAMLLVLCLAGCSLADILRDSIDPTDDTALSSSTPGMELPATTCSSTTIPSDAQQATVVPTLDETIPTQTLTQPEPSANDFVKVVMYIPDIVVDLRYATTNNFTENQIYDFTDVWLRYGTVKKLILVQEELRQYGYGLKIWDGFRPTSAQFKLWDIYPDPIYVANPHNGFSSHSRGNTVDITLVRADGTELVMPTLFDEFSKLADRDYSDCSKEAADNALFLEQLMKKHGFTPYSGEWWHFTDTQTYPVEQVFEPIATAMYYADCNEYISLWVKPSNGAEVITKILSGDRFGVVAKSGDYAMVEYLGLFGYVLQNYIKPIE